MDVKGKMNIRDLGRWGGVGWGVFSLIIDVSPVTTHRHFPRMVSPNMQTKRK